MTLQFLREAKELLKHAAALYREAKLHRIVLHNALDEVNKYFLGASERGNDTTESRLGASVPQNSLSWSGAIRSPDEWLSSAQRRKDRFARAMGELEQCLRNCREKMKVCEIGLLLVFYFGQGVSELVGRVERWRPYAETAAVEVDVVSKGAEDARVTSGVGRNIRNGDEVEGGRSARGGRSGREQFVDEEEAEAVALLNPDYKTFESHSRSRRDFVRAQPSAAGNNHVRRVASAKPNANNRIRPWRV